MFADSNDFFVAKSLYFIKLLCLFHNKCCNKLFIFCFLLVSRTPANLFLLAFAQLFRVRRRQLCSAPEFDFYKEIVLVHFVKIHSLWHVCGKYFTVELPAFLPDSADCRYFGLNLLFYFWVVNLDFGMNVR